MKPSSKPRDPRLDFFRGLGMYIILFAHITNNPWTLYIPARFGFSDATEIFVFCSGMASALAFGAIFTRAGWLKGALRIIHRIWQVYWVHIGVFFTGLVLMLALNATGIFPRDEVGALNLKPFLNNTGPNLIGLFTLTYVPNYFDILPMYIGILAMIPVMMALARLSPWVAMGASMALWAFVNTHGLNFPAELWFPNGSERPWFFNPFAWQLIFFAGFAFMSGWLPEPPRRLWIAAVALLLLLATVPFAWHVSINEFQAIREWRGEWKFLFDKTNFGILRFVHFLALAYIGWWIVGPAGARLRVGGIAGRVIGVISRVGQQSLAVFAASMVLARVLGAVLDYLDYGYIVTPAINILGAALITGVAYTAAYFKSQPWKVSQAPQVPAAPRATASDAAPMPEVRT